MQVGCNNQGVPALGASALGLAVAAILSGLLAAQPARAAERTWIYSDSIEGSVYGKRRICAARTVSRFTIEMSVPFGQQGRLCTGSVVPYRRASRGAAAQGPSTVSALLGGLRDPFEIGDTCSIPQGSGKKPLQGYKWECTAVPDVADLVDHCRSPLLNLADTRDQFRRLSALTSPNLNSFYANPADREEERKAMAIAQAAVEKERKAREAERKRREEERRRILALPRQPRLQNIVTAEITRRYRPARAAKTGKTLERKLKDYDNALVEVDSLARQYWDNTRRLTTFVVKMDKKDEATSDRVMKQIQKDFGLDATAACNYTFNAMAKLGDFLPADIDSVPASETDDAIRDRQPGWKNWYVVGKGDQAAQGELLRRAAEVAKASPNKDGKTVLFANKEKVGDHGHIIEITQIKAAPGGELTIWYREGIYNSRNPAAGEHFSHSQSMSFEQFKARGFHILVPPGAIAALYQDQLKARLNDQRFELKRRAGLFAQH